ncbi:MAG: aminopeptidase P N-terminal domain-containing protein, partial [Lachnospiraceae bacterium]|nr:aminopeptidase P N-terminal domain-containing protein [Lachnospiraceae bacterium]
MSYISRRKALLEKMEDNSILILFSGIENHISSDTYFDMEANRNFFYLTGLRRENMVLFLEKSKGTTAEKLFIEEADPSAERWTGKMVTSDEAKEITGINDVYYTDTFERVVDVAITRHDIANVYFDLYRHRKCDLPDFNLVQGLDFAKLYPGLNLKDLSPIVSSLRMNKDEEEVKLTKKAIEITKDSLLHVLRKLHPGMKEYQVQAEFEYMIHMLGAEHTAFNTIAGSGINGTMMHYETNRCTAEDGSLILLDLGARYEGYNADITRTYPVNGKY